MKKIFLITHCQATHSVENKVGGWYDSKLTPAGRSQAQMIVFRLHQSGFSFTKPRLYSSDLKRAVQTADIIGSALGSTPILDARLREMSFGDHEGISQTAHQKLMVPVSPEGNRMDHRICEGAESRRELAERIDSFVQEIMLLSGDKLVVTHGFAATFFIASFQKIDIHSMGYINYNLNPGSISILMTDDLFCNHTVHLLNG